jgi:hypothetical protein
VADKDPRPLPTAWYDPTPMTEPLPQNRKSDYVRTDELDEALIPLEVLREKLGVPERTLRRRLTGITKHPYKGGKAVKWRDISGLFIPAT